MLNFHVAQDPGCCFHCFVWWVLLKGLSVRLLYTTSKSWWTTTFTLHILLIFKNKLVLYSKNFSNFFFLESSSSKIHTTICFLICWCFDNFSNYITHPIINWQSFLNCLKIIYSRYFISSTLMVLISGKMQGLYQSFSQLTAPTFSSLFIVHFIELSCLCPTNKINPEGEREGAIFQIYSPLYFSVSRSLSPGQMLSDAAQSQPSAVHFCLESNAGQL